MKKTQKEQKPFRMPTAREYLRAKGIFNYGIPTTVICLIINFFLTKAPVPFVSVGNDLLIPVFVTILICCLTCVPGVAGDLKKGKAPQMPLNKSVHPVYRRFADNMVLQCVEMAVVGTLLFACIPGGVFNIIAQMSGNTELAFGKTLWFILKSLWSGFFVMCTIRWTTYMTVAQHQEKK